MVRVSNALNPLLWACALAPVPWSFAYFFQSDAVLKYGLVGLGALPFVCLAVAYFILLFLDRDRLQSEAFVLRQQELAILERKSGRLTSLDADDIVERLPLERGTGNGRTGERNMKTYILVFNDAQVDRKRLQQAVDRIEAVANWYAFFGNVMCLASDKSARVLSTSLRRDFPNLNFLITPVDPEQTGGWMPRSVWSFLNDPQPADTETA